jgi:hypothetical protein
LEISQDYIVFFTRNKHCKNHIIRDGLRTRLSLQQPFVVFYVFTKEKKIYYLPIQEYFSENPECYKKLNQNTMVLHIPYDNVVSQDDLKLQELAKKIYK